jgi:hypothetical protein
MKYQAIARDLSGEILSNQEASLIVNLHSNNNSGKNYYSEEHTITINQFGLFSLVIGEGKKSNGNFKNIPWSDDDIWMQISIKYGNDSNYSIISDSKLLSVPYAFHANTASKLSNGKNVNGVGESSMFEGVPANVWSLKGNRNSSSETDKFGTTDEAGLSIVTDDEERIEITTDSIKFKLPTKFEEPSVFSELSVEGNTYLNTKQGETFNYGNFTVENLSRTLLTGALDVGTSDVNSITNLNGQVTINATFSESVQNNINTYPLRVSGSGQGIAITVNAEDPGWDNNFVTFFNSDGEAVGRIEGGTRLARQIVLDIIDAIQAGDPNIVINGVSYAFDSTEDLKGLYSAHIEPNKEFFVGYAERTLEVWKASGKLLINVIPAILTVCVEDCDDPIAEVWAVIVAVTKRRAFVFKHAINAGKGGGVSFESGGADYAEWLKKADQNEIITYGEVVGIKNGLISKSYVEADQFMAITSNPIIVGAMPEKGYEDNYEKVALMGQVPILVIGETNMGDYILPSGNVDGTAKSVNPKDMLANDYSKVIGVAWSKSEENKSVNYINTAVGFNTNQMGMMLNNMQLVLNNMQQELAKLNPDYKPVLFNTTETGLVQNHNTINNTSNLSKEELEYLLAILENENLSEEVLEALLGKNRVAIENSLATLADCEDKWVIANLRCWVKDVLSNWNDFDISGINVNDNVVLNLLLESTFFLRAVKNRFNDSGIMKIFNEIKPDDLDFDPDLKNIVETIQNGGLLDNLQEEGALRPEKLGEFNDKIIERIHVLRELLGFLGTN